MLLVEVEGCIFDADQRGRSQGHESLDPVGCEAFVNHLHLFGNDRMDAAERVIRLWAAEMRDRWPGREFRIYRHSEADEMTLRFHTVRPGLPNWCEDDTEVIVVGRLDVKPLV